MIPSLLCRGGWYATGCVLGLVTGWGAADWPQFRGPTGQGISEAKDVPVEWGADRNVGWKVAVAGGGWSSPVLAGDRVYLTTAVPSDGGGEQSLRALCFRAGDGSTVWDVEVFRKPVTSGHKKNSQASPTPVVDGGRVYVHFGHQGTACLDTGGRVVWRNEALKYSPVHGNGGSPALTEDLVVFSADGGSEPFVAALDRGTGVLKWKTPRDITVKSRFSFCTPLVVEWEGRSQVVLPGSGAVFAYEPGTGKEIWRARYGEGYSVIPRPVFGHGMVFVGSGYDTPSVYAVKLGGAGDVTESHVAWTQRRGAPNTPSMLLVGGELYFVSDSGIASCVDARTGESHWQERVGGGTSASPVVAEGRIYIFDESGLGTVLKVGKRFERLATNELGERTLASPAVTDGALIVRTSGHLWWLGARRK